MSVREKLDRLLQNQKVLFKLVSNLLRERKADTAGMGDSKSTSQGVGNIYVEGRVQGDSNFLLGDLSNNGERSNSVGWVNAGNPNGVLGDFPNNGERSNSVGWVNGGNTNGV